MIGLRLTVLASAVFLAGAALYVAHDRSRLGERVAARRAAAAACAARSGLPLARVASAPGCGWRVLDQEREGDLLALPFLLAAVALTILLAAKLRHPPAPARQGAPRADDALL